jgi:hypothetical protein
MPIKKPIDPSAIAILAAACAATIAPAISVAQEPIVVPADVEALFTDKDPALHTRRSSTTSGASWTAGRTSTGTPR